MLFARREVSVNKVVRRIIAVIPAILAQLLWLFVLLRWLAPYDEDRLFNIPLPGSEL